MKILFLGPGDSPLVSWLSTVEDEVICTSEKTDLAFVRTHSPDFIISYGYRHIIKKDVLELIPAHHAINLHISLLPWNRGADPNLWSFVDNTPKGVTIHYLDEGMDTGDMIIQTEVQFSDDDTLRTTYNKLQFEIQNLFKENWELIRSGRCDRRKQSGPGSSHTSNLKKPLEHLLTAGWDTPVSVLMKYASEQSMISSR